MNDIFSISQINRYLKNIIESEPFLTDIWLRGEISNFKAHYSGHLYLTLKDEQSAIKAVMFRGDALNLKIVPEDGMKVLVRCRIGVYEASGSYQAYIKEMVCDGLGDLHIAFEQLKQKLDEEGLFSPSHKKPIPPFPEKIGVVTSATGAAVQDICNILGRRYPIGEIIIYPSLVQGDGAPANIINGINFFDKTFPVDVIIVGRGGGSIEDLWAFNDEGVARAVYNCSVPVISAVGHETDFTICDFVADLRAPTPSAAAELAATPVNEISGYVSSARNRLVSLIRERFESARLKLRTLGAEKTLERLKNSLDDKRTYCDEMYSKMVLVYKNTLQQKRSELSVLAARLDGSSPLKIMEKGYSAVLKDGNAVADSSILQKGDTVELVFAKGSAAAEIKNIHPQGAVNK